LVAKADDAEAAGGKPGSVACVVKGGVAIQMLWAVEFDD
jgi:hypothetical protein